MVATGITIIDILHLQKSLCRCTNTLQSSWLGEDKFKISRCKFKIMFGLGLFLDKCAHLASVVDKFAVGSPLWALLIVDYIGYNFFQKWRVMTNN